MTLHCDRYEMKTTKAVWNPVVSEIKDPYVSKQHSCWPFPYFPTANFAFREAKYGLMQSTASTLVLTSIIIFKWTPTLMHYLNKKKNVVVT